MRHSLPFSRRDLLRHSGLGLVGASMSGWFPQLAQAAVQSAAAGGRPPRQAVLLWMSGGPSQIDTFDMKPNHTNGGELVEAKTSAPGLRFSEHLPKLASQADRLAVVRSISSKEGDHARATQYARTGQTPGGDLEYPSIACSLAAELPSPSSGLPAHVAIASPAIVPSAFGPGFLGPHRTPAAVEASPPEGDGYASLRVENLDLAAGVSEDRFARRKRFWRALQGEFLATRQDASLIAHDGLHRKAIELMEGSARDAFVEVSLGSENLGWDTHIDGFRQVRELSAELDNGWGTLMQELRTLGLLDTTTILCLGEFGRTPRINDSGGRDHFPDAWSCVLAGGGMAGGQAYGKTSDDGTTVVEDKVGVADVLATFATALGVDPHTEQWAGDDRPIKISEGQPIAELLA